MLPLENKLQEIPEHYSVLLHSDLLLFSILDYAINSKNEDRNKCCFQRENAKQKIKSGPYLCVEYAHTSATEENSTQNQLLSNLKRNICYSLPGPQSTSSLAEDNTNKLLCEHQKSVSFLSICDFTKGCIPQYFSGSTKMISRRKEKSNTQS